MNELQIIDERTLFDKQFRVYRSFEEPLFLAKDVAEWISHSNPRSMLKSIDDREKVVNNVYTLGGLQETWFLTEDGLYEVLMQSRKPIAKAFKAEVKKILKEIRLQGSYQPPAVTNQIQALETFFSIVKSQQEKLEEHDCKIQECDAKLELQCAALQELSDKIENFKPREILVPVEQIINTDIGDLTLQISKRDTVSTTQVAQMYGYSAIVFNRLLEKMGIIEPHESKGWQLTADNMARGLGVLEPPTPKCAAYILWTPNGRKFLKAALRQIGITPKKRAIPAKRKRMSRKTALKVVS